MRLSSKLTPELVLVDPEVRTRDELFRLFGDVLHDHGFVDDPSVVERRLGEREEILSTGIGGGVAVPHAQVPGLGKLVMTASVHPDGIEYPALDDEPVRLVFCLLGDTTTTADHLAGLARLARLARSRQSLTELVAAPTGQQFVDVLVRLEES